MLLADIARTNGVNNSRGQNRRTTYVVTGTGDAALSVYEGMFEGLFRQCCVLNPQGQQLERGEQLRLFVNKLKDLKIYWVAKELDPTADLLRASLAIPRYSKIRELILELIDQGIIEVRNDYTGEITAIGTGNGNGRFHVNLQNSGPLQENGQPVLVDRIFHNNGNLGATPILDSFYRSLHPQTADADIPKGPALLRSFTWTPVYAPNSGPLVGMRARGPNGEVLGSITGNTGLLLALRVQGIYSQSAPANSFFSNQQQRARFNEALRILQTQTLTYENWANGTAVSDEHGHFVNPFGVRRGADITAGFVDALITP